jgi:hypothetical protein
MVFGPFLRLQQQHTNAVMVATKTTKPPTATPIKTPRPRPAKLVAAAAASGGAHKDPMQVAYDVGEVDGVGDEELELDGEGDEVSDLVDDSDGGQPVHTADAPQPAPPHLLCAVLQRHLEPVVEQVHSQ